MPQTQTQTDDFDLQAWLSDISADNSLSQEEVKSLGTILGNDKVRSKLKDQVLMRRDYSRKTQDLADQRRQVETDIQTILAERADLAQWKQGLDVKLQKAYDDLDSQRSTVAQFEARMQTIADQTGLDANELMKGLKIAKAATGDAVIDANRNSGRGVGNGAGNFDPTKFVPAEDFNKFARQSPMLYAEVEDIFSEYQELTGKPLKMEYTDTSGKKWSGRKALLIKTAEHNGRAGNKSMSVRDVYETDFSIPQLRDQQLRESIRAEERGKLDAEYKTKLSADMLNGGTPGRVPLADRAKSVLFDEKRDHRLPAEKDTTAATGDKVQTEPPPSSAARREERWQRVANGYLARRAQGIPPGQDLPAKTNGAL